MADGFTLLLLLNIDHPLGNLFIHCRHDDTSRSRDRRSHWHCILHVFVVQYRWVAIADLLTILSSCQVMGKKGKQKKASSSQQPKSGQKGKPGASVDPLPTDDLDKDMYDLTVDDDEEDADETPQFSSVQSRLMEEDERVKQKGNGKTRKSQVEESKDMEDGSDEKKLEGASSSAGSLEVKDEKKMTRKELKKLKKKVKWNND